MVIIQIDSGNKDKALEFASRRANTTMKLASKNNANTDNANEESPYINPNYDIKKDNYNYREYNQLDRLLNAPETNTGWDNSPISKSLQNRLRQNNWTANISPNKVNILIKNYLPQLKDKIPFSLNRRPTHDELKLNPNNFTEIQSFDEETEKEFNNQAMTATENINKKQGRAKTWRFVDREGVKFPTGAKLEIIDETGRLTKEQVFAKLNAPNNIETLQYFWGVVVHEQAHKLVSEVNPYVKITGWYEPIKISLDNNNTNIDKSALISTRGQANFDEVLLGQVEELFGEDNKNRKNIQNNIRNIQKNLNKNTDINTINKSINDMEAIIKKDNELAQNYAFWCQNLISAGLVPLLLLNSFPVHAESLSPDDLNVANESYKKYRQALFIIKRNQEILFSLKQLRAKVNAIQVNNKELTN